MRFPAPIRLRAWCALAALPLALLVHARSGEAAQATPRDAADALVAADRAFADAAARTDLVTALTAMMAPDVLMPLPGGTFAEGPAGVAAALRRDTLNASSRAAWTPVRAGISADGAHGFTFGFLTVTRADGATVPMKYLAYWVRGAEGWRVAGYKRARRPAGEVATAMLEPALPARLVAPVTDAAALEAHRASLAQVERDFSDESQRIGLGPAFEKYGSADAMNLGGPQDPGFVIGSAAIGALVGGATPAAPATIHWSADRKVLVASSGDLGVNFGVIRPNTPPAAGQPAGAAFFTVWRRAGPGAPWRYVAE